MLLSNFGLKFKAVPAGIQEDHRCTGGKFAELVKRISKQKASHVSKHHTGLIIAADTIVVLDGKVIGKPTSPLHAIKILKRLSGKTHHVYTGVTILPAYSEGKGSYSTFERTCVKFRKLTAKEINSYVCSRSPMDKAGAYGIQDDFGCTFVEKIEGDFFNVVGLPILKTYRGLKKFIKLSFHTWGE